MFCKSCGKEILAEAVVCVGCGVATDKGKESTVDTKKEASIKNEIICGWIGAVVMPIVGLIVGLILLTKGKVVHGIGQIVLSIFMSFFWYGFFSAMGA